MCQKLPNQGTLPKRN
jgi:hypothetical protein